MERLVLQPIPSTVKAVCVAFLSFSLWHRRFKKKNKSPGGESNARSPDYKLLCVFKLQSGALNQLGYREELLGFWHTTESYIRKYKSHGEERIRKR